MIHRPSVHLTMYIFGTLIEVAVIWLLIVVFTGSKNSEQDQRTAWIIAMGIWGCGFLCGFLLPGIMELLGIPIQMLLFGYLLEKFAGTDRRTTVKICCAYLGFMLLFNVFFWLLSRPVS